jgi:transforming growth factor-beta-induced protein
MVKRSLFSTLALVSMVAAVALPACGGDGASSKPAQDSTQSGTMAATKDIVDTAAGAGQFKTLVAAVKAAELESTLRGPGPFTVFAPTDDAFAKLPPGTLDSLLKPENKSKLQAILTYHVVSAKVPAADASKLTNAKTVNGKELKLAASSGGGLKVDGANVVKADIEASNGIIHVIDAVVLPQ